jgi:hypothetical protein
LVVVTTQAPSVAAVDAETGERRWAYPLPDWASSPTLSTDNSQVAVAARDNALLVISISPLCTIDTPQNKQTIGPYPDITGRAWAWGGAKRVSLIIAGNKIELPIGPQGTFNYSPDLSGLKDGSMEIQCLAESKDNQVERDAGAYKSAPILAVDAQKNTMTITMLEGAPPGTPFRLFVRNAEGYDLDQLSVDFAGQHLEEQVSPLSLRTPAAEGPAALSVSRRGFESAAASINVVADKTPLLALGFGVVVVLGLVGYVLFFRKGKRPK